MSNMKPPDCGPHCKVVVSKAYGPLRTIKIKHCKRWRCKLCHKKP